MNGTHTNGLVNGTEHKGVNGHTKPVNGLRVEPSRSPARTDSNRTSADDLSTPLSSTSIQSPTHGRKESNPLAPPFIVSAPGKTIVFGEHAVVHGKAAIAAAISLRSYLFVTTLSKSNRTVSLKFTDIGLDHTWNILDLPWAAFAHPTRRKKYYDLITSLDKELVEAMQPHISTVSPDADPHMRKIHQSAASCFLYLFLSLGSPNSPPCIYALRSTLPIGQGLGSSASISVCLSTALLLQCRALSGPHPDQQSQEAEEQLERINRWAFVGELLIHGNPSGVDNTVAANGHAVLFQRKDYSKPPSVSILRDFPELPLLLVDTRQPKSTAAEVAKVGQLKTKHPAVIGHILDAIDNIVRSAHEVITTGDFEEDPAESIQRVGELMTINHGLLSSLGVSHPKLECLRHLVEQSGVGWTKLTGAGGGGCAITLLKPDVSPSASTSVQINGEAASASPPPSASLPSSASALENLTQQLEDEGFEKYTTTLGGDGVGILYPAVINDADLDQEMFLTAQGREGVEALVSARNDPEAWKYWRP